MRESVITNCEKKFIIKNLEEHRRLDGRAFDEFRDLSIDFGRDWGCCYVSLGKTRVLAQVSCEIQQPKSSRPSEGILSVNVELNPLGAPHFEPNRQTDLFVILNRILEKCIKDSKAVDLESLCIKVNEKVWAFRVDVNVLNHEGNIIDCASIAALAALAHFRRPDITCDGEDTIIHSYSERDPIHTVIHHYPVCISYAIFNEGDVIVADPTLLEEGVADANLIIGLNGYKEVCGLHLGGKAFLDPDSILRCTTKAAGRANIVIQHIKKVLAEDSEKRNKGIVIGFESALSSSSADINSLEKLSLCLDNWKVQKKDKKESVVVTVESNSETHVDATVESLDESSAVLLPVEENGQQVWNVSSSESDSDVEMIVPQSFKKIKPSSTICID
ncbi:hypothetical protein RN001_003837 [Aquatica leii]|uniref:Exosome complex component RRP45 n=1 Tax=Aquatica leii TaxID=1421715 RepID=A0AAN7SEA8_9COLE|nr:hypothetical protein RN001_003837 [Aquatica leii]